MHRGLRRGFTLTELLVVVAIIGVLLALTLAAVMRVRGAALRVQSMNNLRQIILGVAHFAEDNGERLPTIDGSGPNPDISLHAAILPYLEQTSALEQLRAHPTEPIFIELYLSPADPTIAQALARGSDFTISSYAANARVFKNDARLSVSIPDGLSNTIGFAEHYGWCNGTPYGVFLTYTGLGNAPHRATFADGLDTTPDTIPLDSTFQAAPAIKKCDPFLAQTPHSDGMVVALLDGGVRQISPGIAPQTYWGAVTPDGNEALGEW